MNSRVERIDFHGLRAWWLAVGEAASVVITAQGAQVVSWTSADGREQLFLSSRSRFAAEAAIRGGIPVVFPQFAATGPLPRHGFARTADWELAGTAANGARASVVFHLHDNDSTRGLRPASFCAEIEVQLGVSSLRVALSVSNTGDAAFAFSAALHTYLRVTDIEAAFIDRLHGCAYRHGVAGDTLATQADQRLRIFGEVDRIYLDAPPTALLHDGANALAITRANFPQTVVWNPGAQRSAMLDDMEPDGWRSMLCVEAALIDPMVTLEPGGSWTGWQRLEACDP